MRANPEPPLTAGRHPRPRIRAVPDGARPPERARWSHDHHTARSTIRPAVAAPHREHRAARRPRPGPRPRPPAPLRDRPQGRGRGRWPRAPPRHRPADPAGGVRRARVLRRRRPDRVRRLLAAGARGRRGPCPVQPRRAQSLGRAGHRRRGRRARVDRGLLGRLLVPLAARPGGPGRPLAADPQQPAPPGPARGPGGPGAPGAPDAPAACRPPVHTAARAVGVHTPTTGVRPARLRPARDLRPAAAEPAQAGTDPVLVHAGPDRARRGCPRHRRPGRYRRRRRGVPRTRRGDLRPDARGRGVLRAGRRHHRARPDRHRRADRHHRCGPVGRRPGHGDPDDRLLARQPLLAGRR